MKNLTNSIATVAKAMTNQINADKALGVDLTSSWYSFMLDCIIESEDISFENDTAEIHFKMFVSKKVERKALDIIFPVMQMDANGNYTTNPVKWV